MFHLAAAPGDAIGGRRVDADHRNQEADGCEDDEDRHLVASRGQGVVHDLLQGAGSGDGDFRIEIAGDTADRRGRGDLVDGPPRDE